ncbi:DUF6439 family protein [Synechococcus sp. ATX 2A4]|uniref:DUF6439 family protein n=1 Tax=Synechococcus sp. ATX 2A4 TaxID=2823727 RepID=UPI0020CC28F8|nr:DUF6439 family protein [Synechococcus sp. ATX 2A4]
MPSGSPALSSGPSSSTDSAVGWPLGSRELAEQLQRLLVIDGRDWHALKGQKPRRAAEQIASALVHLLSDASPAHRRDPAGHAEAIALLEHGLGWLKGERSDPGCPSHGPGSRQ